MDTLMIGTQIKKIRTKNKMNQKSFAEKIGINQSTLSSYENGNAMPSVDVLLQIAKVFNISLDWLCGISDNYSNITSLRDLEQLFFQMDEFNELRYEIEVNDRLPDDIETPENRWYASIRFYGNDAEHIRNRDLCQFLTSFRDKREEFETYFTDKETYDYWKQKLLERDSDIMLTRKEYEKLSFQERIRRRDALLEEKFKQDPL